MIRKVSPYLDTLLEKSDALCRQFVPIGSVEQLGCESRDPLEEERFEAVPGLLHKYPNRILCVLTTECAAYCQFCTRQRIVGVEDVLEADRAMVDAWVGYVRARPEITEAILSGGDPFVAGDEVFEYALRSLTDLPQVTVLRIGTRAVVSDPDRVGGRKLEAIRAVEQPVYVGINFEHPDEITPEAVAAVTRLRKAGAILYSQTVFLREVNDDYETLRALFSRLVEIGVRPYYIYRCDPVPGSGRFRVDFRREREIMTRLRGNLSGLACPTYVIDTPHGSGKIPVPLDFWDFDDSIYRDFDGREHEPI